jgi:PAS domain S-box-containing protein
MPNPRPIGSFETSDYQELINNIDDVVFRVSGGGCWELLNPAWEKQLGWGVAACLGRNAARFIDPRDRGEAFRRWRMFLRGEKNTFRGELRILDAAGRSRWMLVSARGLAGEQGQLRGAIGTLADITAAKTVEGELIAARAAAETANKSKSEFLSTMSHELRTPLNAVIGLSESLIEVGPPFEAERTKRYLGIIHQSGRKLLGQINDIIDLARIEAGRTKPNFVSLDLGVVCAGATEVAQRDARLKPVALTLRRPEKPVRVAADEKLIRQLVHNLISNAVKFTPANGSVVVEISALPEGGGRIAVQDTGIGIAAEKLANLFRPFTQGDASLTRHYAGTGLGLALVDRIAQLHGGKVTVQSALGQGSTFTLTLSAEPIRTGAPK